MYVSCSDENGQAQSTKGKDNTSLFAKEGDTLKETDSSFLAANEFRKKFIVDEPLMKADTTVTEVVSQYGRAHIVCRQANTLHTNDFGETTAVAHGCLYSNGVLYEYTWWPDHYVTIPGGGVHFVHSGSRYVVNSRCSCP